MIPIPDNAGRLRQAAFAILINTHLPVAPWALARVTGLRRTYVRSALDRLAAMGWIDRQADGRVIGSEGLSLTIGPHRLHLERGSFQTWCAYDALGIASALAEDSKVETVCGVCDASLTVDFVAGIPAAGRLERLWLAEGGSDLRADFCTPTVLLCSPEHATTWGRVHGGLGEVVTLEEAARLGAAAWGPSVDLARTLKAYPDAMESFTSGFR